MSDQRDRAYALVLAGLVAAMVMLFAAELWGRGRVLLPVFEARMDAAFSPQLIDQETATAFAAGLPLVSTASMGQGFPAGNVYRIVNHPGLAISDGLGARHYALPKFQFIALRVPRGDLPAMRALVVARWRSQAIGTFHYREQFGIAGTDWMVIPIEMDNVAEQWVSARYEGADEGNRIVLDEIRLLDIPEMRYEELEHVQ